MRLGVANVDGHVGEWTSADRFADLAHDGSFSKPDLGTLSLRYDCSADVLYLWVDAEDGARLKTAPTRSTIVRVDGRVVVSAKYGDNDRAPDGHWVARHGSRAAGWEASARIQPGKHDLLVHTLVRFPHRTVHALTVPRTLSIRIDCPPDAKPTPSPAPTATAAPTRTPKPEPTAKPTKSPKPEPTAKPTRSPTPEPTRSAKPTKTPKPTKSPKPTCAADGDRHGDRHGDRKHCDDANGKGRGGKGHDGKGHDGKGHDGGIVIILPLAFGATAWATRPKRDPIRRHRCRHRRRAE